MLRLGDTIRLTPKEQETFREFVGPGATAKTLVSFRNQLESVACYWDSVGCPEAEFLAAITRSLADEAQLPAPTDRQEN